MWLCKPEQQIFKILSTSSSTHDIQNGNSVSGQATAVYVDFGVCVWCGSLKDCGATVCEEIRARSRKKRDTRNSKVKNKLQFDPSQNGEANTTGEQNHWTLKFIKLHTQLAFNITSCCYKLLLRSYSGEHTVRRIYSVDAFQ